MTARSTAQAPPTSLALTRQLVQTLVMLGHLSAPGQLPAVIWCVRRQPCWRRYQRVSRSADRAPRRPWHHADPLRSEWALSLGVNVSPRPVPSVGCVYPATASVDLPARPMTAGSIPRARQREQPSSSVWFATIVTPRTSRSPWTCLQRFSSRRARTSAKTCRCYDGHDVAVAAAPSTRARRRRCH